jgi:nucleotide-binding universal stress UspA family protein
LIGEVVFMATAEANVTEARGRERVIVVGVDGSKSSSEALKWAAEEARMRGATLKVVRAWQVPAFAYGYGTYVQPATAVVDWRAESEALLDDQVKAVLGEATGSSEGSRNGLGEVADLRMVCEVLEGPAAQVLIEAATGAELLVVGSRGLGGFSGLLLGSVSAQLAHHAPCPLTIVRNRAG